jgi:hypothetical protein
MIPPFHSAPLLSWLGVRLNDEMRRVATATTISTQCSIFFSFLADHAD